MRDMFKSLPGVLFAGLLGSLVAACQTVPHDVNMADLAVAKDKTADALPAPATPMPQGREEPAPPPGFVSFCMRYADQCTSAGTTDTVQLDQANWDLLETVNRNVNAAIWPEIDSHHYGRAEFWAIPADGYGDCEDYALTKRKALAAAGIPERALRIAVVRTLRNNLHAVLTIATNEGDYVLDSETDQIRPWSETGYEWLARQDDGGAWGWVAFNDEGELMGTAAIDD
jgi:predicted transglutaminase-like cysteine proteinase